MKKIIVLLFLIFIGTKLWSKPVGLANCGNTCFQNAFIQMLYQVDPLIDILSTPQNLFAPNTLGYTFQNLVWDIIKAQTEAQNTNKSVIIGCGSIQNPTNLKQLTEGVYSCMNRAVGAQADLSNALKAFLNEIEKTPLKEFSLTVSAEAIYPSDPEVIARPKFIPIFTMEDFSGTKSVETYIKNIFISGQNPQSVEWDKYRLLSLPKFMLFRYTEPDLASSHKDDYFPDQLNLTEYIKGDVQALYQLRAIGIHIGSSLSGHWATVVRDRDGKLYLCNDSNIQQVNTWRDGIGTYIPMNFLYVLKTTIATTTTIPPTDTPQDSGDSKVLAAKLNKLQQSLQNLEFMLKKQTAPITPPPLEPEISIKPKITTYEELKTVMEKAYENDSAQKKFIAKNPDLLNDYEQTVAITIAKYLAQELLKESYQRELPDYIPFMAYVTQQVAEQYSDKTINLHCVSLGAGELDKELFLIRALRFIGYKTITLIAIDLLYEPNFITNLQQNPPGKPFRDWFFDHKIGYSFDVKKPAINGVTLQLFEDSYKYLQKFYTDNLPKNHLFLMIQPGTDASPLVYTKINPGTGRPELLVATDYLRQVFNYLKIENFKANTSKIEIYLPYKKSDFFLISDVAVTDRTYKNTEEYIQKWTPRQQDITFRYQASLIEDLTKKFFPSLYTLEEKTMRSWIASDISLSFCELIKYTAINPAKPLAFQTLNFTMRQITDISGSLEQIYKRYYS